MNAARLLLSLIAGLSAALIAYSAVFVRGNVGGVMGYLHARASLRRLREGGAGAEAIAAAQTRLHALAQTVGDPALAARLIPLELLVGVLIGALVWWLFGTRVAQVAGAGRWGVQERMVLRFAHRMGGHFTLRDLGERSPLSTEQAREITAAMLERGSLRRDGEGFRPA